MVVKLLTEYRLEFLSLKRICTGWSESKHVKMPHCWKSHALAQFLKSAYKTVSYSSECVYKRNTVFVVCLPYQPNIPLTPLFRQTRCFIGVVNRSFIACYLKFGASHSMVSCV